MSDKAIEAAARAVADEEGYRYSERRRRWDRIAQTAITAYLTAKEADGFVMVPVEATARMVVAGANERENGDMELHARKWRAMIAARPPHLATQGKSG